MRIIVVGAGGHARDTAWLAKNALSPRGKPFEFVGFIVSDLARLTRTDSAVLGDERYLRDHPNSYDALVLGIGSPGARLAVARRLTAEFPDAVWPTLVHPTAQFDAGTSRIGRGAMIAAGVIGTVNLSIGDFAVLNPAVTLGHEASVGAGCVMNHACGISGGTTLEEGVLVGTGARVLQYLRVGQRSIVGAGAVVTKDVPPDITVVGVPAHPIVT